jgi:hypothetical protein
MTVSVDDDDDGPEEINLDGLYAAKVTSNADPLFQYRVQFTIPNMVNDDLKGSPWARPGGMQGSGATSARGLIMVPKVDSQILIHFLERDLRHPVYYTSHPSVGGQLSHMKTPPRGGPVKPEDAWLLWGWEGERIAIQVDERAGNEYLRIIDKQESEPTGNAVRKALFEMDLVTGVTAVCGRNHVVIRSDGHMSFRAPGRMSFNDRVLDNNTTDLV